MRFRNVATFFLFLAGLALIAYAMLGVWVTMHSSIESDLEGLALWCRSIWYLIGPDLPGASFSFWNGLLFGLIGFGLQKRC